MRIAILSCFAAVCLIAGEMTPVERPFLIWTKADLERLREAAAKDPVFKQRIDRMREAETRRAPRGYQPTYLWNLFSYLVLGDKAAGETEKAELRKFIGRVPEPLTDEFKRKVEKAIQEAGGDPDKIWMRSMASFGDAHMRDEQTMNTIRYDLLYHELTADERKGVEQAMRGYIQFHLDGHKPWHPDFRYGRHSWLPNMSWPRAIGTHLMAAALQDQALIERMFNAEGGWKWYFDRYLTDGRFYNEEFNKYYSNIGTMLLWCEALERLGLSRFGYGYTGAGGATMRRHLAMLMDIGYPRTDIPGGRPNYRIINMGDARNPPGAGFPGSAFEGSSIVGWMPNGRGGNWFWSGSRMNGPLPKFALPFWYEIGHRRFPEDGYGFFLAELRGIGEERYLPTPYFGLDPIDPAKVQPPPAPSYLARERGFAFLRADESPAYWTGPAPAVGLQFGMYYTHYAHDAFTLLGFHAFNRPIWINTFGGPPGTPANPSISQHRKRGYIGEHPWKDTMRGHAGVTVDNLRPDNICGGENGLERHEQVRFASRGPVRFAGARATGSYPGVTQERALLLVREYLVDAFALSSSTARRYEWNVTGPGQIEPEPGWAPTRELDGAMLYREVTATQPDGAVPLGNDLADVVARDADNVPWHATVVQRRANVPATMAVMTAAWWDAQVGARVRHLPAPGTRIFAGKPPGSLTGTSDHNGNVRRGENLELGGVSLIVRRTAPAVLFTALHEPFAGGPDKARVRRFERIAEDAAGVAARIVGEGIDDRVVIRILGDNAAAATYAGGGERLAAADHGWLRIHADRVEAWGGFTAIAVTTPATRLVLNGQPVEARREGALLVWGN